MNLLSESLTIGLLLTLVFGALFFYLYSRVTYVEKRVGLVENILIDIQMKQEQQPVQMLPPRFPNITFHEASDIHVPVLNTPEILPTPLQKFEEQSNQQQQFEVQQQSELHQESELQQQFELHQQSDSFNENMYSDVLEEAHATSDISQNNVNVSEQLPKLNVNYASMTKEELIEVAKKKGIRVSNRPGREKLLQLIQSSESLTPLQPVAEE